ncbi:hypothetical protein TrCOL_g10638 [Triparma columacea]|uniref:Uncharacterized protein n=1 Tax=Triparma columacea TaxID=722753 RepID=A0A9W7GHV0_9STRA|nr:hypothetical protein TrCOL_g10638 [Triparma columacea]
MAEVYGQLAPTPGTYAEIEPSEASGTSCENKEPEQEVTTTSKPYGKTKGDEIAYLKELLAVFKAKDEEAKAESEAKEAKIAKLEEELSAAFAKVKALTPKKVAPHPDDVDLPAVPCGKNEANYSLKHDEIEKEVVEMASQSKLGMINMSSKNIVKVELGRMVHEEKDKVLEYIMKESHSGEWKRWILEDHEDSGFKTVYWALQIKGGNMVVSYVLDVKAANSSDPTGPIAIELKTVEVNSLKKDTLDKFLKIRRKFKAIPRVGKLAGVLRIKAHEFGQSLLILSGTVEADINETKEAFNFGSLRFSLKSKSKITVKSLARAATLRRTTLFNNNSIAPEARSSPNNHLILSIQGLFDDISKHFHSPEIIDKRRKSFFVQSIMPNAPPLTTTEAKMVEEKKQSLLSLAPKAKRIPDTLQSDTQKFIYVENASSSVFGVCSVLRVQQATLNSMLPLPVLIRITKKQMSWADRLQSKYRRNNKQVDSETREGLIKSMQEGATELPEEQEETIKALEKEFQVEGGWQSLPSPYRADYGTGIGKLVRGETKCLFTSTNLKSSGGVPRCKMMLYQYLDAGA